MTYEAPGVINTTNGGTFAVQTFDNLPVGTPVSATHSFTPTSFTQTIGGVNFAYSNVSIEPDDEYNGLSNSQYAAVYNGPYGGTNNNGAGYTLSVSRDSGNAPINYFGLYVTASDDSNTFTFSKDGIDIGTFTLADYRSVIGVADQGSFFANFFFTDGQTYDKVTFSQPVGCCGFESDNHTVGTFLAPPTGNPVPGAVPEPASWALMLVGFGAIGAATRRRQAVVGIA